MCQDITGPWVDITLYLDPITLEVFKREGTLEVSVCAPAR